MVVGRGGRREANHGEYEGEYQGRQHHAEDHGGCERALGLIMRLILMLGHAMRHSMIRFALAVDVMGLETPLQDVSSDGGHDCDKEVSRPVRGIGEVWL